MVVGELDMDLVDMGLVDMGLESVTDQVEAMVQDQGLDMEQVQGPYQFCPRSVFPNSK